MQRYLGALTIVLLLAMALTRVFLLRRQGIVAMKLGGIDKTDFLIPPFVLLYVYAVFANAFRWPNVMTHHFFDSEIVAWIGVAFCVAGLLLFLSSLMSFGRSFRIGIDTEQPDSLITDGIFGFSRNPIYVAFAIILIGGIPDLPELVDLNLSRRCHLAVPPSGASRRRLPEAPLWCRLRRLFPPRAQVSVTRLRARAIHFPHATSTAPIAMSAMPAQFGTDGRSPRKATANIATSTTESLSIGATRAASPSLSARK
jgi:protein-S-isoprenylcysteine O-methyltransferase Ste14